MSLSRRKTGKFIAATLWVSIGAGLVLLLLAAIRIRENKICNGLEIEIIGAGNNLFADKNDVRGMLLHMMPAIEGTPVAAFDLHRMEQTLLSNAWIGEAQLFFDNNETLRVRIKEREPVARIFTPGGRSYYIDKEMRRLPLSSRFSANVPVFTHCPLDNRKWNEADSSLLQQVTSISAFIAADKFWMAQIEQINYSDDRGFEMYPQIGEHVVVLGDGYNLRQKFDKLYAFYKEVLAKVGWNTYSIINVQFKGQVVATRKEPARNIITQDTIHTINSYASQ